MQQLSFRLAIVIVLLYTNWLAVWPLANQQYDHV